MCNQLRKRVWVSSDFIGGLLLYENLNSALLKIQQ